MRPIVVRKNNRIIERFKTQKECAEFLGVSRSIINVAVRGGDNRVLEYRVFDNTNNIEKRIVRSHINPKVKVIDVLKKFDISEDRLRNILARFHVSTIFQSICGFEKKTAYYETYEDERGFTISAEDQMLSSPYYSVKDLRGAELEILNKIK